MPRVLKVVPCLKEVYSFVDKRKPALEKDWQYFLGNSL
jgi:hypothetical protein